LRASALEKSLLKRTEPPVSREAFHRQNSRAVHLTNRNQTRIDHLAVDDYRTGSAFALAAAFLCPCQPQVFAQDIEQPPHRPSIKFTRQAVNLKLNLHTTNREESQMNSDNRVYRTILSIPNLGMPKFRIVLLTFMFH
jgi:hypothetical protein